MHAFTFLNLEFIKKVRSEKLANFKVGWPTENSVLEAEAKKVKKVKN